MQTLNYHTSKIFKIIELSNNKLVSCSADCSIVFYSIEFSQLIICAKSAVLTAKNAGEGYRRIFDVHYSFYIVVILMTRF